MDPEVVAKMEDYDLTFVNQTMETVVAPSPFESSKMGCCYCFSETNSANAPENRTKPNRNTKLVFQIPTIHFRGAIMLVSGISGAMLVIPYPVKKLRKMCPKNGGPWIEWNAFRG